MRNPGRLAVAVMPVACLIALSFVSASPQTHDQPPPAEPPAQSLDDPPASLVMTAGKSVIVDSALPVERISVGFGDVAEATAISPHELVLNGKTPGITSMIVWQEGGSRRTFDITVLASRFMADSRLEAIKAEIERELPGQSVSLSFENETVFLRGTVSDITSADRAVAIASTLGKTVNLLYVDVPPPETQILLRVKFASVDRSLATTLGLNILSTGAANTIGSIGTGQFVAPALTFSPGTPTAVTVADALNLFFFRPDLNLGATIAALEVKGLLQVLSEPNVLAENGKQASFLAGGEFPFPSVSAGSGGAPIVSIQFREFGIRLNFLARITPRGTIDMQIAPEVSALDFTNGLSLNGFNVPALTTRKLNTEVELNGGQSFAIGGLLDNRVTDTFEKIPFIGDIPILGKLFQSKSVSKTNTELIIIVTPELVRPVPAGQPVPALNFPKPFLAPNTSTYPATPGQDVTGPVPVKPPNETIPVEKLIESMRPATAAVQSAAPKIPSVLPPQ
jgi:pilus assembly protein CpaC